MTTNSTKLLNSVPTTNRVLFLSELTNVQKELIISLQNYNWRIAAVYSLDENLMRITRITTNNRPANYQSKQLGKMSKCTFLSLIRKEVLVLESEELRYNNYYMRVFVVNQERLNYD